MTVPSAWNLGDTSPCPPGGYAIGNKSCELVDLLEKFRLRRKLDQRYYVWTINSVDFPAIRNSNTKAVSEQQPLIHWNNDFFNIGLSRAHATWQYRTRSWAITVGPRNGLCRLKSCYLRTAEKAVQKITFDKACSSPCELLWRHSRSSELSLMDRPYISLPISCL